MLDQLGRNIGTLRISVTDLCNLRCVYCMPPEGVCKQSHGEVMRFEEIVRVAEACTGLGICNFRLTGGEPLVRRGISNLVRMLRAVPGVRDIAMTTNGTLLSPVAEELKAAGLNRVNVSLDTLDAERYAQITGGGSLNDALEGIRAAGRAGLYPLRINAVLLGGFNRAEIPALVNLTREYPIEMRFIELMPMGPAGELEPEQYLGAEEVLKAVPELVPEGARRTAELYRLPEAKGTVGLIRPVSRRFCGTCDRLRLTADGNLKPCLHSAEEIPIRGLEGKELKEAIETAVLHKPGEHSMEILPDRGFPVRAPQCGDLPMYRIGG